MVRRRRFVDSRMTLFAAALSRWVASFDRQTKVQGAFCACAAYAVADCLVSFNKIKTLGVAHLRVAGSRRSGRRSSLSERPAGCLWSSHAGAGV